MARAKIMHKERKAFVKIARGPSKVKKWFRSRSLEQMNARFGKKPIQNFIKKRLASEKAVRVLEIGFGEGRVLMELRKFFPQKEIVLYGINDRKEKTMKSQKDFIKTAVEYGIASKKEAKKMILPKPYFYDAGGGLKFKSKFFDLIISQVSFQYVKRKDKLIEEIWRVLKQGGKAFLHIDSYAESYPDFLSYNKETPRFLIYKNGRIVKLSKFFRGLRQKGFDIRVRRAKDRPNHHILLMTKNTNKKLRLNLAFDGVSSFSPGTLKWTDKYKTQKEIWWGYRSVYILRKRKSEKRKNVMA